MKKRLSKYLADCGVASRRAAEELIFSGKVSVNGTVTEVPQTLVSEKDKVLVKGKPVFPQEEKLYFLLNKPCGYLCSNKRPTPHSKLVIDLFEDLGKRLFTVGRLDKASEGLLLVTNDGDFSNKVIHPSSNITKVYIAKTDHQITLDHLKALSKGGVVEGVKVVPTKVQKIRKNTLKISIKEGKKREVRKLLEFAGLKTMALKRIQIGPITLGNLPTGYYKPLSQKQIDSLIE